MANKTTEQMEIINDYIKQHYTDGPRQIAVDLKTNYHTIVAIFKKLRLRQKDLRFLPTIPREPGIYSNKQH